MIVHQYQTLERVSGGGAIFGAGRRRREREPAEKLHDEASGNSGAFESPSIVWPAVHFAPLGCCSRTRPQRQQHVDGSKFAALRTAAARDWYDPE